MATAARIRAFQLLSSRTLELLCEEASAHLPTPLERLERLCADLLFDRQRLNPPLVSSFPESELPF
ncbi:hypothetical protein KBZ14_07940 [Synechococcus sp. HJ21-Hayes]|uniref:hypothetical protein n=1 Tax=Synechococcus sp. HJ21-Hayes TaxID=2823736 RepID=UPI0020CE5752|nr:hypothetical protein [Synechococcus sp. HJ21-Hayes]MCP9852801.1 hypothetical protein [Synechococcus sp. HJ21-Hayes]